MSTDQRLHHLMTATSNLLETRINDPGATLGDLGLDSVSLAGFLVVCEEVYGDAVDMNKIELDYDVSLRTIHSQIVGQLDHAHGGTQNGPGN